MNSDPIYPIQSQTTTSQQYLLKKQKSLDFSNDDSCDSDQIECEYSTIYDSGYVDPEDYPSHSDFFDQLDFSQSIQKDQPLSIDEAEPSSRPNQPNCIQNPENTQLNMDVVAMEIAHKDFFKQLEKFSAFLTSSKEEPSQLGLAQFRCCLSKMSQILSKMFFECEWIYKIGEKTISEGEKKIVEQMIIENVDWLIEMITNFKEWDLDFNAFYHLLNQLHSQYASHPKINQILNEWKLKFYKRFSSFGIISIKVNQSAQEQISSNSSLFESYFQQKIQSNLLRKLYYPQKGDQTEFEKFAKKLHDIKKEYIHLSGKYLKQIHDQIQTIDTEGLSQMVFKFLEAYTSSLIIEHYFFTCCTQNYDNFDPSFDKFPLKLQMRKLHNNLNQKIYNWCKNNLSALSKFILQIQNQERLQISVIQSPLIKEFVSFWSDQKNCSICLTAYQPYEVMKAFHCDHEFCHHCLSQHVNQKLQSFILASCPNQECKKPIDKDSKFYSLMPKVSLKKEQQIEKYMFVQNDEFFKLCPTSKCKGIVAFIKGEAIVCHICSKIFCEKCFMLVHEGSCDETEVEFLKKNYSYARCSQCKFVLQKVSGCNHMTCKCGYEFCYKCGDNWHPYQQCREKQSKRQPQRLRQSLRPQAEQSYNIMQSRLEQQELAVAIQVSMISIEQDLQEQSYFEHELMILQKISQTSTQEQQMFEKEGEMMEQQEEWRYWMMIYQRYQ